MSLEIETSAELPIIPDPIGVYRIKNIALNSTTSLFKVCNSEPPFLTNLSAIIALGSGFEVLHENNNSKQSISYTNFYALVLRMALCIVFTSGLI